MVFAVSTVVGVAGLALGAASALDAKKTAGIQAAASKRGMEEQTKQSKLQMEEANANSHTSRALQVINNNRQLRVAGKQFDAATQNMARNSDAYTRGSLEARARAAEAMGSYAANLASKGVGGSSADAIAQSIALQQSRQKEAARQNQEYLNYDQAKQLAGIMPTALNSLDMTVHSGGVDTSVVIPQVTPGTDWAGVGASLLGSKFVSAIPDLVSKFTQPASGYSGSGLSPSAAPAYSFWGTGSSQAGLSGIKL